jgi:DNA-binding response OmpR family regulator
MWLRRQAKRFDPKHRLGPILVIDDDEDIRAVVRDALVGWGYDVLCAEDGGEAMAMLRDLVPAAIILDLWMPHVNGFVFREWQLAQRRLADVPVIVLTAAGAAAADSLTDVTALYKPIDFDLLDALLHVQVMATPVHARG